MARARHPKSDLTHISSKPVDELIALRLSYLCHGVPTAFS